jgi:hypothetical protein
MGPLLQPRGRHGIRGSNRSQPQLHDLEPGHQPAFVDLAGPDLTSAQAKPTKLDTPEVVNC